MQVRAEFETQVLALLRQRPAVDTRAARQLELLCQRQLDAETLPGWRTFWSLATHFFEGLRLAPNRSIEEAVRIANDSELGLKAYVFGAKDQCLKLVPDLYVGTVQINGGSPLRPEIGIAGAR